MCIRDRPDDIPEEFKFFFGDQFGEQFGGDRGASRNFRGLGSGVILSLIHIFQHFTQGIKRFENRT